MIKFYQAVVLVFLLGTGTAISAENTKVWSYAELQSLSKQGVALFAGSGHLWTPEISIGEKTPDGHPSLALRIDAVPADAKPSGKQVNFVWPHAVGSGQKYRISFYVRGSVAGEIPCAAARGSDPYSQLGKGARWLISVTPEWRKVVHEFTVDDTVSAPQAMPRLYVGNYPVNATLWLGPVKLERLDLNFVSLLSDEWKYRLEADEESLPVDRIPVGILDASLQNGRFDIGDSEGAHGKDSTAVFYQEFGAPADGVMTVGMAADWFFECFVNGQSVFSTMTRGNLSPRFEPADNIFNVPVRKGRNLIAVRVRSGSKGWSFVSGVAPVVSGNADLELLFKPEAGAQYRPVDDGRFLEVKAGTALDFSGMDGLPRPAGVLGRLMVGKDGKPVFEKRPDSPVRFFAFNWTPNGAGMWRQRYHEWDKQTIDRFADAVERRNYNMIRIHIPETFLIGWDASLEARKWSLDQVKIPQTVAELEKALDAGNFDRLDYIIAAFKKRGIYVSLDLAGRDMITHSRANEHDASFKSRLFTEEKYRNHWKLFTGYLMSRVNPYTQTAYKDEPSIAFLNFINEQDLRIASGLEFLTPPFRDYLRRKYNNDDALTTAWGEAVTFDTVPDITEANLRSGDRRAQDTGDFLIETTTGMTRWFYDTLRETGYKGLVNHWDMIMRMLELPGRALLPVVAQHVYFAHPGSLPARGLVPKSARPNSFAGNYPEDTVVDQSSSLNSSYFRAGAAARFFDRPYFNTEYSHSAPNRFRHERGLYFSSYAALQDWDALTAHQETVKLTPDPFLKFDNALDPISRVNETLTALIYLRGDVKTAPSSVALILKTEKMFPQNYLAAIGDDYAKLALVTRLGVLYPEIKPLEPVGSFTPTLALEPEDFSYLNVSQWYVRADATGSGRDQKLFQLLRDGGILSKENPTDPAKGYFVSETGEIALKGESETMTVITPRLEGAIIKKDEAVSLGRLTINRCTRPATVAVAALDGEKALPEAARMLLVLSTNAFNTGQIFDTPEQRICYESGNHPALIEALEVDLTLDDSRKVLPEIHALNFDGTRAEKITAIREGGKLRLRLNTAKLKYGASIFEVIYP
jgi:hypothetical protein